MQREHSCSYPAVLEGSTRQGRKNLKDMLIKRIIIPPVIPFTHSMTDYKVEENLEEVEEPCAPKGFLSLPPS